MNMINNTPRIQGVLFDFDGTLTGPGVLNFPKIKKQLGCPVDQPILEFIESMPDRHQQKSARAQLDQFEIQAARQSHPNLGAVDLIHWIKQQHLCLGIITRNSRSSVLAALENFNGIGLDVFDVLVSRDDPAAPKPSPDGIHLAAQTLRLTSRHLLMVGDYIFDCQAGQAAGAQTVLLDPHGDPRLQQAVCDYRIEHLSEVKKIVALLNGL